MNKTQLENIKYAPCYVRFRNDVNYNVANLNFKRLKHDFNQKKEEKHVFECFKKLYLNIEIFYKIHNLQLLKSHFFI